MSRLTVALGLDASRFRSGAAQATSYATNFGTSLRGSLMTALGPIALAMEAISLIKEAFADASKIADISDRFQVSTDSIQRLGYAGKKVGLEMESVAGIIKNLNKTFAGAITDPKKAEALKGLGFSAQEIASGTVSAEDAIIRMSEALDNGASKTEVLNRLQLVLGKSAQDVAALLQNSTAELKSQFAEAPVMSKRMVEMADKMGDRMSYVFAILKIAAMGLVAALGMVIGAVGIIIGGLGSIVSYLAGVFLGMIAKVLDKLATVADTLGMDETSEGLKKASKNMEDMSNKANDFAISSGEFAMKGGDLVKESWKGITGEEDKAAESAKKTRREIEGDLGGGAGGAGSSKSGGISSLAAVGGGGLTAGPSMSYRLQEQQLGVARQQLEVQQKLLAKGSDVGITITE